MTTDKKPLTWEDLPLILTTEQVAELLQVHVNTVKHMVADGRLRGVKLGKSWRYNRADVMACMGLSDPPAETWENEEAQARYSEGLKRAGIIG